MSEWTPAQGRAVYDTDRSMVVAAGAGSGKTRVLVGRYIHLLESGLADLDEIVAITFTEKAATEMKGRVWSAIVQRQADAEAWGEDSGRWRDLSRRLGRASPHKHHTFLLCPPHTRLSTGGRGGSALYSLRAARCLGGS
jgi:ATP-dependent helicase/nuclease subunit A